MHSPETVTPPKGRSTEPCNSWTPHRRTARTRRSARARQIALELARGWALSDLGLNAEAAIVLDRQLALVPVTSRRTRARFGTRRALAHALSGEVDQSCRTFAETIDDVAHVDSATIRTDLRQLTRTLGRWHNHDAVRKICPDLKRLLTHR